jgi:hypothetical protein
MSKTGFLLSAAFIIGFAATTHADSVNGRYIYFGNPFSLAEVGAFAGGEDIFQGPIRSVDRVECEAFGFGIYDACTRSPAGPIPRRNSQQRVLPQS